MVWTICYMKTIVVTDIIICIKLTTRELTTGPLNLTNYPWLKRSWTRMRTDPFP